MATVSKWTPFGVALDLTATGSEVKRISATQFTVKINASWKASWDGAQTNYGMTAASGGVTHTISAFNGTKRSSGSGSFTGTYSISGNGAATKAITVTFRNFNTDNGDSATKSLSFNVSVPAWTSYKISYNANGGSGAPGQQTKWKDQTLKLSTTKPTRTGYSFLGWSTSSTATSATYSAGGNYTANSAATLYAVWKANTYKVTYNANGGSGAPSAQTKTYGKTLTLSSVKPTRANYNFLGWATSASATTATYAAGSNYTTNSAITLYAVWELAYKKPEITNVVINRDTDNDSIEVSFAWKTYEFVDEIEVEMLASDYTHYEYPSIDTTTKSGTIEFQTQCDSEATVTVNITVWDKTGGYWTVSKSAPGLIFAVDFLAGGKGVAFGKSAEKENTAEFAFDAKFNKPVYGKVLGMDRVTEIPANADLNSYLDPGCYAIYKTANAKTIANVPDQRAGRLEVWSSTGEGVRSEEYSYLKQKFVPYNTHVIWERDIIRGADNVWTYSDWNTAGKILWGDDLASGMYMTAGHTASLKEAVSAQRNGIILVFCAFNGAEDTNYSWQCFFVPKQLVALSTSGHTFTLSRGKFTYTGTKYLYIYDTNIKGHDDNNLSGTSNGITYNNGKFVLRYVIGV